jgi:hypothetical protein
MQDLMRFVRQRVAAEPGFHLKWTKGRPSMRNPPAFALLKLLAGLLRGVLRLLVRVLGRLMRFEGELHSLLGVFVSGQMIFFSMMYCGGAMGVCGLFMKFSGALMRIVWHDNPF